MRAQLVLWVLKVGRDMRKRRLGIEQHPAIRSIPGNHGGEVDISGMELFLP